MSLELPQFPYELIPPARTEKIAVTPYWKIKGMSPNAWRLVGSDPASLDAGVDIRDYLPELVGLEDAVHGIWNGQKKQFKLESIQRDYHPDTGTELYFDLSIKILPWEGLGCRELVIILEDTTSRNLIEKSLVQYSNEISLRNHALDTARHYNQQIIDSIADAVITTSQSGKINYINPAFQTILGFTQAEFIGKPVGLLIRDPKVIQQLNESALAAIAKFVEIDCIDSQGTTIAIECICGATEAQGFVYTLRDIRDRKAAAAELIQCNQSLDAARQLAQESNQIKSNLIATLSQVATLPAKSMLDISELLLASGPDSQPLAYLRAVQASSREILNLTNDIHQISQGGTQGIAIENRPINLRDDLQDLFVLFDHLATEKQIKFVYNTHPSVPRQLLTDGRKIQQILVSLLENAFKFTNSGFISLDISAKQLDGLADRRYELYFTITDTGIGMQPDEINLLFSGFHPVGQMIVQHQRLGLGLAVSNYLISLLGGTMKAESQYGRGSKFSFSIVAEAVDLP